jgi:hypothetical protein
MAIYSAVITTNPNSAQETLIEVEGDVISYISIRFPPGPLGLLKVAIFYGIKQIFPKEEGTYFAGDDETIAWEECHPLPESPAVIRVRTINEDDTYSHTIYVRIATLREEESTVYQLASSIVSNLKRIFGMI